jgi:YbbR domain-containing protein
VNWHKLFRENWLYKLAAVLIVFLLWLDLTAGERQSQEIATRLVIEVQDSAWVLVEAPDEVVTTFQGRNRDLLSLMSDEPEIRIGIREVTGPAMRISLDADLVAYDRELGVRATLVVPTSLELEFERQTERRVPVSADLVTVPALGYTVVRPLLLDPDSVTVRGGASQVERVTQVTTRRITLEDLEHPVMRDVPVEAPAGVRGVELDPPSVLVTVPVDSLVVRQARLPVRVMGNAAGRVRVDPDTVDAVIRGAWSAVRRQLDSIPWAVVRLDDVPAGPTPMALEVDLASGGFVQVTPNPAEVTVRPEGS